MVHVCSSATLYVVFSVVMTTYHIESLLWRKTVYNNMITLSLLAAHMCME